MKRQMEMETHKWRFKQKVDWNAFTLYNMETQRGAIIAGSFYSNIELLCLPLLVSHSNREFVHQKSKESITVGNCH